MSKELEKLMKKNCLKNTELIYPERISYNFYKVIWKYILNNEKYNYKNIIISFKVSFIENRYYIRKNNGINYELVGEGYKFYNKTYFEGCINEYVDNILNTNIDIRLLLNLFKSDNFKYEIINDGKDFWISLNIEKCNVVRIIDNILNDNKILKR